MVAMMVVASLPSQLGRFTAGRPLLLLGSGATAIMAAAVVAMTVYH